MMAAEQKKIMAAELTQLVQALRAGKTGGMDAATSLEKVVGPSADLRLVVESLKEATAVLSTRAKAQVLSDNPLPAPPDVPMYYGGHFDRDTTHLLLEAFAKLECTESKLALACTCRAWHDTLWHPAFWTTFQLPQFSSNAEAKRFLERQPQRFQRTACFSFSIRGGGGFTMSESTVLLLFQMAPRLRELIVSSDHPVLGDTFVRTLERAAAQERAAASRSSTAVPPQAIGKRLKRITFKRIWLSSKSFRSFVRTGGASVNNAVHSESDDEEGPPLPIHTAAVAAAASSAPRATIWAHSLEAITFFNLPPCRHRRETPTQIIYSSKPIERSMCELIQGLGRLTSVRVHNPDAPANVGPAASSLIELDIECGRAGLDPFDPQAHRTYVRAMPPIPKVPPNGRSYGWHTQKEILGRRNDFVYDPTTAEWLAELKAQETKAAAAAAKAAAPPPPPPPPPAPPAPDLRPLELKNAKGRRVLIPRTIWPDYPCTEQGGLGWAARVTSCSAQDGIARVHFESAVDEEGRPYPDEHLRLADLQPL